jgi:hypothetical protein
MDPNYFLPGVSAMTFLGVIQRGSEGNAAADDEGKQKMMLNVFRGTFSLAATDLSL